MNLNDKVGEGSDVVHTTGERWKQCRDKDVGACSEETDQCCAVVPCRICLELILYGQDPEIGYMDYDGGVWSGSVADLTVTAYWERDYYTDVCYWVIEVNGEVVYRETRCYDDGVQNPCRTPGGTVEIVVDYEDGTLNWETFDPVEIPRVEVESGCYDFFCGVCECTCDEMCASIVGGECNGEGTLSLNPYYDDCTTEGIFWEGEVDCKYGTYHIKLTLVRDDYTGDCVIEPVITGPNGPYNPENQYIFDCKEISLTWTLEDGVTLTVNCAYCGGCNLPPCESCCDGTHPTDGVWITCESLDGDPRCACWDGWTCFLPYRGPTSLTIDCEGLYEADCPNPCPGPNATVHVRFLCGGGGNDLEIDAFPGPLQISSSSCDPFEFCWDLDTEEEVIDCSDATIDDPGAYLRFCITP